MPDLPVRSVFGPEDADRPSFVGGKPVVFGQFAMRRFVPVRHGLDWHGHVEFNWLTGGEMTYRFETDKVVLPEGQMCFFWAGIPHQTVDLNPVQASNYQLTNMYFPLDVFLSFRGIGRIQRALLSGAVLVVPEHLAIGDIPGRWHQDYQSKDLGRFECLTMELHALMRRLSIEESIKDLRNNFRPVRDDGRQSGPTEHVVRMIEAVIQNTSLPVSTQEIATISGLNANYASNMFKKTLGITLKQFIVRMRLIRARELLLSSDVSVSEAAFQAGFSSASQFYDNYKSVYGSVPSDLRQARPA
ncbi:Melibiose operon regulatory protein [Labrenzia sp. THAF82]|uniref:helix-turn-helix domain-containing protein n=1 Tax=Labrenzia sp. THAF82 TaxID=2587861 RepID=UPI001269769D|nr:helix-turn-helix domain-containing protein [Labrenzia sp. THAF82]QFT30287.1 Melibiose operon regulatory protein [Labrenzia sp. THAF82]